MSEGKIVKSKRKPVLAAIAAAAAMLLLCAGGFGLMRAAAPRTDAVILLDVNPSLSLSVDAEERVLAAEALNDDAREILGTMELKGTSLEVAVNAIIGSMLQKGYLSNAQNSILVSVENADAARGEELQRKVSQIITGAMQTDALDAAVLSQSVRTDDAVLNELAKTYRISVGKAALIQELVAQDASLTFEALAPMTINEIALIASSRNWSSESVTQSGAASDKAYIGKEEALRLACTHAGVTEAELWEVEVEFDSDDGIMIYEVEFETAGEKYEYDLDARTGQVLKSEKKTKDGKTDGKDDIQAPDNTENPAYIGEAAAKTAALTHAGVDLGDTYYITCYVGYTDGKPAYYGVKFGTAQTEYEYKIDLYTGAVLEAEQEAKHGTAVSGDYIGESAALSAALTHAGVSEADLTEKRIELDEHSNIMVYEIEFRVGKTEYEYEVNAVTGEILRYESERHE